MKELTKAEHALHSFTCNASSIITWLLRMENEIEREYYNEDDRLDFEHFRFCVLDTLARSASLALDDFNDYKKEAEK